MNLGNTAFEIGRRVGKHPFAGRLFCLSERFLPVRRVARAEGLVAFHHPRPAAEPHILVVPTVPFPALADPSRHLQQQADAVWNMIQLSRWISLDLDSTGGWKLVINGGTRQHIGQAHGHLLEDPLAPMAGGVVVKEPTPGPDAWDAIMVQLRQAAEVPDNGYSLVVHWFRDGCATAEVTQSAANV